MTHLLTVRKTGQQHEWIAPESDPIHDNKTNHRADRRVSGRIILWRHKELESAEAGPNVR